MMSLIVAGETVFLPAFHLGRYFKSSLLATFEIDEFQLGRLGAIYGVIAMACYFLGGPLADRFSPRKLLTASLVITALGSLYMATLPSFNGLQVLFGFWGMSTILASTAVQRMMRPPSRTTAVISLESPSECLSKLISKRAVVSRWAITRKRTAPAASVSRLNRGSGRPRVSMR